VTRRQWGWLEGRTLWCALFTAIWGGTLGCSSSDEATPSEVCQQFVTSYCDKAVSCAQETDRGDFAELCDFSFRVYLPCDEVTNVWRDAGPCQSQIAAIRCSDVKPGSFPESPSACQGLFGIQ
jgi:hypothetical protein